MRTSEPAAPAIEDAASNGALRLALQRSEGRRLLLLLGLLGINLVVGVVRHLAGSGALGGAAFPPTIALVGLTAVYAAALVLVVRRANALGRLLPIGLWTITVVLESLVPTAAILILQRFRPISRLEALTAPALVAYGTLILLSILRLRPWLCLLSGLVAALGHAGLFLHAAAGSAAPLGLGDYAYYLSYPVYLAVTGLGAAVVTRAVREYFLSSLREAATRRSLDRLKDEMEMARTIQQGLMPDRPPAVPGFDIAGWNRPADRTGGDYYDWHPLPDGRLAVLIADVSGHGLGPAILMAVCRAYARACVPAGPDLAAALRQVNDLLHRDVRDGRFVTLAMVVLDGRDGRCELLSAGHAPMLLYRARGGVVEELRPSGPPLGILAQGIYRPPQQFSMEHGDVLLLLTDGFHEAARVADGQLYGIDSLSARLREHAALGAAAMIGKLEEEVRRFVGAGPQRDDMTAVAIRRS